jgi:hypothetical protein
VKVKVHLRVAKNSRGRRPFKVVASSEPNLSPLYDSRDRVLPTTAFALVLDVPDEEFKRAEQVVAEVSVPSGKVSVCAEVISS